MPKCGQLCGNARVARRMPMTGERSLDLPDRARFHTGEGIRAAVASGSTPTLAFWDTYQHVLAASPITIELLRRIHGDVRDDTLCKQQTTGMTVTR